MADTSPGQSRLTVLSGPLAGRELVIDDVVDNILVGSDSSCRFHLDAPGISPIHARLWMDASGVTVYDTGSETGLYVNDDRVTGQAPLRNGDILWLGTPGSDEVIMIQCRLPVRAAPVAPEPAPVAPAALPPREIEETMVIVPHEPPPVVEGAAINEDTASLFAIAAPEEPAEVVYEPVSEVGDLVGNEEPALEAVEDEPPTLVATHADEVTFAETQAIENPEDATAAMPAPVPPPPEEPAVKFALDYEDQPPAFAVPEAPPPVFEDETESPTVMVTREVPLEQTLSMPFTAPEPEPTVMAPIEVPVEPPAPAPPPPAPPPPPPPPPRPAPAAAPPPPKPRPATPPIREPRPPRPEPSPTPPPARGAGGSGAGRMVGMGVGGLVVLGILGYAGMRFLGGKASPAPPVTAPPTTMAAAPVTTLAVAPPTTEAAAPVVDEGVTVVKSPPPTTVAAAPSPVAKTTPAPTPTPASAKGPSPAPAKATPAPATPPPAPSGEAARAQQVATLLGQADAAAGGHSYDQAAGLYDEALKLDPSNAKASAGKAAAVASAAAFKKTFVSGKTVVSSGKAAKALSGFDSEDVSVSKAPDYSGRIEFEVTPRNVKPGDSYSVKVFLTNDGKKSFKIGSLTVGTTANGNKTGGPASASVKEVQPQQRVSLQETNGTWQDGTNSWNLEVAVVSDHGDTFKNTVTWR